MKVLTFSNINWFCFWDEELLPTGVFRRLQIYCQSKKYFSLAKYAKADQVISSDDTDEEGSDDSDKKNFWRRID